MKWIVIAALAVAAMPAGASDKMLFWNETSHEMKGVYLAPTGSGAFGPNQALNDVDQTVSADERLLITGIVPGHYDVKLVDTTGRSCIVRDVQVRGTGKVAFSVAEDQLTECK